MTPLVLYAPMYLTKGYDKVWSVNLNQYRNTHHQTLNKMKIQFKEFMEDQISTLPRFGKFQLLYRMFPRTKVDIDTNNVCSIVDKFFCDALVEFGKVEDDCYRFLTDTRFTFGGVDPTNPRVEICITGDIIMEEPMKIIYENADIRQAVADYVATDKSLMSKAVQAAASKLFTLGPNQRLDVAIRKEGDGNTATVRVIDKSDEPEEITRIAAAPRVGTQLGTVDLPTAPEQAPPQADFVEAAHQAREEEAPEQEESPSPVSQTPAASSLFKLGGAPAPAAEPAAGDQPETAEEDTPAPVAPKSGGLFNFPPKS